MTDDGSEKIVCTIADTLEGGAQLRTFVAGDPRCNQPLAVAHQLFKSIVAHRHAEILRRNLLQLMRLVDDRVAAFRDDFAVRALPH